MFRLHATVRPDSNRYYRLMRLRTRRYTLPGIGEAAEFQRRVGALGITTHAQEMHLGHWEVAVFRYDPRNPGEQYDDAHR